MDAILIQLSDIFSTILTQPGLVLSLGMETGDLDDWDSFKNVEILMECEKHWCIRFTSREIDGLRSVGDLAKCIATKTGSAVE